MNIGLMIFSVIITTLGLIVISELAGRKAKRYFSQFLTFLVFWPVISISLKVLLVMVINPDSAEVVSTNAADQILSLLPEFMMSGYIGEAVGFIAWSIYRWIKPMKRRYRRRF